MTKLQRGQNNLARIVTGAKRRDHITPVVRDLHWLPVANRIEYKVALTMQKVQHHEQPHYLSELVDVYQPLRTLLSSSPHLLTKTTWIKTKLGQRCFTHAAAVTWNSLPAELRVIKDERLFKSKLRTHLFSTYYGDKINSIYL